MLIPLNKPSLLLVIILFLTSGISGQKTRETLEDKAIAQLHYMRDHPKAVHLDREKILDYFIKECTMITHFPFATKGEKGGTTIHLDSLFSPQKLLIDKFINNYKQLPKERTDELEIEPYKSINNKILSMSSVTVDSRDRQTLVQIFLQINKLPSSNKKVILLLKFALLNIRNETYKDDLHTYLGKAEQYAHLITNLYEMGQAYIVIGDFARGYEMNEFAIRMYFLANESIENSDKNKITKLNDEAKIFKKIAYTFNASDLPEAQQKRLFYFRSSFEKYNIAKNAKEIPLAAMTMISFASYYWKAVAQFYNDENGKNQNTKLLEALRIWLTILAKKEENDEAFELDTESMYLSLYSVAANLDTKDKKIALLYYLRALQFASLGHEVSELNAVLQNISYLCSALQYDDLALKYAQLQLYVATQLNDQLQVKNALLQKAEIFYYIKNYDSAQLYVNNIIFDLNLRTIFYPTFIINFMKGHLALNICR